MFTPDQVWNWRKLVKGDPALKMAYLGQTLGSASLTFDGVSESPVEKIEFGQFFPAANIFGSPPHSAACLDGIGLWPIYGDPIQPLVLENARIVGNRAVLSGDGQLFLPRSSRLMTQQDFLGRVADGHQGFLVDDAEEGAVLYFPQRPQPGFHNWHGVFLSDIEAGNYGSFVFRQLPQLMFLRDNPFSFDFYVASDRTPFFMEALDILQLPSKPVFTAREVSGETFRAITFYKLDDAEGFLPADYRLRLNEFTNHVVTTYGEAEQHENIYVSRSLSAMRRPWYRVMKNELEVESFVKERGFEVIYPEAWSLKEQIKRFAKARRIIGPSGSGLFNIAFALAPQRLVDIETHHVTVRQHAKLFASCGAEYSFLFSRYENEQVSNPVVASSICPLGLLEQAVEWLLS